MPSDAQEAGRYVLTGMSLWFAWLTYQCPCPNVLGCHKEEVYFHFVAGGALAVALMYGRI